MLVFVAALAASTLALPGLPAAYAIGPGPQIQAPGGRQDWEARIKSAQAKVHEAEVILKELGQVAAARTKIQEAATLLRPALEDENLSPRAKQLGQAILELAAGTGTDSETTKTLEPLRQALQEQAAAPPTEQQGELDRQVAESLRQGNSGFVRQLGRRSVPGLLGFLQGQTDQYYETPENDPLALLLQIDLLAADQFVKEQVAKGPLSVIFKLRLARVLSHIKPFASPSAWMAPTDSGPKTALPNLLAVCDQLVLDPSVRIHAATALEHVAQRRYFIAGMRQVLREAFTTVEAPTHGVRRWIGLHHPHPEIRNLLLDGFHAPHRGIRTSVHEALMAQANNHGIYAKVLSGSTEDRAKGIQWLVERRVYVAANSALAGKQTSWLPGLGEEAAQFLDALLRDPELEVRLSTTKELYKLARDYSVRLVPSQPEHGLAETQFGVTRFSLPLKTETLMALAVDPNADIRMRLAELANMLDWPQEQAVLAVLAVDDNADIRAAAREEIGQLSWLDHPQECAEILRSSFTIDSQSKAYSSYLDSGGKMAWALAARSSRGMDAILRLAIESGIYSTLQQALIDDRNQQRRAHRPMLLEITPELWADAIVRFAELGENQTKFTRGASLNFALQGGPQEATGPVPLALLNRLSQDTNLSPWVQTVLLHLIPIEGDNRITEVLANGFQRDEVFEITRDSDMAGRQISLALVKRFSPAVLIGTAKTLLRTLDPTDPGLSRAFKLLGSRVALDAEMVAKIAADPAYLEGDGVMASRAMRAMQDRPTLADPQWLAGLVEHPGFGGQALTAIGHLRNADHLPAIAKIIEGPATHPHFSAATSALAGFLSDESARLLLIAARKSPSEEQRTWCLAQIEEVAALQDAETRWASRGIKQATREVTVGKLMGMLASQDQAVRIEAIRGLATWEAVEAMPDLIGLLADPDADVAQAARKALDRLNGR